jgi:hypothetical protein
MPQSENSVWYNTVDQGTWEVEVTRVTDYQGELTVRRASDDEVILCEVVGLAYGAIFGPDVDDVEQWQDKVIKAIDAETERRKDTE